MNALILLMQKSYDPATVDKFRNGMALPSPEFDQYLKGSYQVATFGGYFKSFRMTDTISANIIRWVRPDEAIVFVFFDDLREAFNRWIFGKFPQLAKSTQYNAIDVATGKVDLVHGYADPKRRIAYAYKHPGNAKHEWAHLEGMTHGPSAYFAH